MNGWLLRAAGAGLLILLGMAVGTWATTSHFRPLLDSEQEQVAACKTARANLDGLAQEQGKALGELVLAGNERQNRAGQAVKDAGIQAQADYAAANWLLQEQTGGDRCAAAVSIIDQELGL